MRGVAICAGLLALATAGCGGGEPRSRSGAPVARQGGEVRFLSGGDIDFVDPGQTYYTFGYQVQYAVNRPLYSFSPEDGGRPRPDLAEGDPQVAADQKTMTVRIKPGIRFAPPVDRAIAARDVKYAIERAFSANVPNGYAFSYFADIVGAPAAPTKAVEEIRGIEAPDDRTLVIRLERPVAATVSAALAMPITVPVPEERAAEHDRRSPSDYDRYVAFTGPYMIRNDAAGKLVGRDPGGRIELVRNPNWRRAGDYRPAYLDAITIETGNSDLTIAARRALRGDGLMCCDVQPPTAVLREALRGRPRQVGRVPGGGTLWIALNTKRAPFDDLDVRRAVLAGFDREALQLTRGGREVGPMAQHFIPPGTPGFEESGGEQGFPELDYMRDPGGDRELAARYLRAAGHASGRYEGQATVTAIAANTDPDRQTAAVAQQQLEQLGFDVELRNLAPDTMFSKFCGVPASGYSACPNVGWFRDFPDPQSLLEPTFKGAAILPQGNVNWSQLDDPEINAAMASAVALPAGEDRARAWAAINRMVVERAAAIPYVWNDAFQLASPDVLGVMNPYSGTWDLSFSSVRPER
jgi:peptide/nickel transport system substrate-binding protein